MASYYEQYLKAMELIDSGCFKIRLETGGIAVFVPKPEQRRLYKRIGQLIADGIPVRLAVLKSRQLGFSTAICVLFEALTIVMDAVETFVTAHKADSANKIFDIYRRVYRKLDEEIKPTARNDSKREMVFDTNDSRIAVEVAGKDAGRSGTVNFAHLSEMAYWPNQIETFQGVMASVPQIHGAPSIAIIETTANGWGDTFHQLWQDAEAGKNSWEPWFVPWYTDVKYSLAPGKGFQRTAEEGEMQKLYGLTDSQLNWRRYKIATDFAGNVDMFDREYPITPSHAFKATGSNVFRHDAIQWQLANKSDDPINTFAVSLSLKNYPVLTPKENGELRVHCSNMKQRNCVIGVDPSDGLDGYGSYSAIQVIDLKSIELVATWHGKINSSELGDVAVAIAKSCKSAIIACEVNNMGVATEKRIYDDLQYRNVYWRRRFNSLQNEPTWEHGWRTDKSTKAQIIGYLQRLVDERLISIYDYKTLVEMQNFLSKSEGNDDLVMSLAIASFVGGQMKDWLLTGTMAELKMKPPVFKPDNEDKEYDDLLAGNHKRNRYRSMSGG